MKPKFQIKGQQKKKKSPKINFFKDVSQFMNFYKKIYFLKNADASLFLLCCLLKPPAEMAIVCQLQSDSLQLPYMADVYKSYSIEKGRLQVEMDISLKVDI